LILYKNYDIIKIKEVIQMFDWFLLGLYDMYEFLKESLALPLILGLGFLLFFTIGVLIIVFLNENRVSEEVIKRVEKSGYDFGSGGEE
jgi:hypothetical protein